LEELFNMKAVFNSSCCGGLKPAYQLFPPLVISFITTPLKQIT